MMLPPVFRSRFAMVLGALLGLGAIGLWGVWRWAKATLPGLIRTQLSEALDRDVSVGEVSPGFTRVSVSKIRVAKTRDPASGVQVSVQELEIQFRLSALFWHMKTPARAIRTVILRGPYLEVPIEQLAIGRSKPAHRSREGAMLELPLPKLPRTWFEIKDGLLVVTKRGKSVAEVRRLGAKLDLRDLPSINGSLTFIIAPESEVALSGRCHLSLMNFDGQMAVNRLDLGQISDLVRLANPDLPGRLGGRLKAELEVQGGFMTLDELVENTTGRGSLELTDGSLSLHGRELIAGAGASGSLDGREIALEQLDARVLQGRMVAAGTLGNLGLGRLRMRGRLDRVPLPALRALSPGLPENLAGSFNFEFSASGTGRAPVFAGRLTSPAMGVPGIMAEHVTAEAVYAISEVRLTAFTASLWHGSFRGAGTLAGLDAGEPALDFTLKAEGIDVARSPLGDRFTGRGNLEASLKGPVRKFTGTLGVTVADLVGHRIALGGLKATARFDGGAIAIEAATLSRGVAVRGTLVLGDVPRIEGGSADVRELLPVIFALVGVQPPAGLDGRVSGRVLIEGPVNDLVITAEAVGSAIRLGTVTIADVIRVPRFTFARRAMEVPEDKPLELTWGPENSTVRVHGRVPIAVFSAEGGEPLRLHLETRRARLDLLKRLDLIKAADGTFDLTVDLGGTASQPVWTALQLSGEGRKLALKEKFFDGDFDFWKIDVHMKDSEADAVSLEFGVAKQRQVVTGTFGMNGWVPASADLTTETVAASRRARDLKGLPLVIEDVAEIRARLNARLIKLLNEDDALLTGPDPERGAELVLTNGVITYLGGGRGERGKGVKGQGPAGAPAPPSPIGEWFSKHFSYRGTVLFEKNVSYTPSSFITKGAIKGFKGLFGDREGWKKFLKAYSGKSGAIQGLTEGMLAFDVKIKEGSFIGAEIRPGHEPKAVGHLDLAPGGTVMFAYTVAFRLVDEAGQPQRIEFQPGEHLEAHVTLTAETVLYGKVFATEQGAATVDEMAVRLVLTPPGPDDPPQEGMLKYKLDIRAEPETITGEIDVPVDKGAGGVDPLTGLEAEAGSRKRPISFRPDRAGLYAALFGFDKLTSTAATSGGPGTRSETAENLKQSTTTSVLNFFLSPLRKLFGLDVLSVRQSEQARRRNRSGVPGGPGAPSEGLLASTLKNNELTVGKAINRYLFLNQHAMMVDTSVLSARNALAGQAQQTNSVGLVTELEFRRSSYKLTAKRRWYTLPDDPQQNGDRIGKGELFLGGEMSRNFTGVSQHEPFRW